MKNPQYVNALGGIFIEYDAKDGGVYADPGSTLHAQAEGGEYGPVAAYVPPPVPAAPVLEDIKAAQTQKVNSAFEQAAQELTAGYPEAERLTWPAQQAEALAWGADSSTPTPYLDGIASARGVNPADMRQMTLAQVQAFQSASQYLVGTRQRLRDAINAAETEQAVLGVRWPE